MKLNYYFFIFIILSWGWSVPAKEIKIKNMF